MSLTIREKALLAAGLIITILIAPTAYSVLMLRRIAELAASRAAADSRASGLVAGLDALVEDARRVARVVRLDPETGPRLDESIEQIQDVLREIKESSDPPIPELCVEAAEAFGTVRRVARPESGEETELSDAEADARAAISRIKTALQRAAGAHTTEAVNLAASAARFTLWSSAIGFVVAILLWASLVRSLSRPLRDLLAGTEKIGRGQFDDVIPIRADDELGRLAGAFNRMAEALGDIEKMKAEFLAAASHGLRTPLACAKGHISSLASGRHGEMGLESLKTLVRIENEIDRVSRFVDQLLDLGRLRAGRLTLSMRDLPAAAFFTNIGRSFEGLAEERGIRYKVDVSNDLPARFNADPDRLGEALINLLDNAFKYTPLEGQIGFDVQPEEGWIRVIVDDTGPGIPAGEAKRIFERYYRGGAVSADGAGLGLAISRGIIEKHGGAIWSEEKEGPGARFVFKLPVQAGGAGPEAAA